MRLLDPCSTLGAYSYDDQSLVAELRLGAANLEQAVRNIVHATAHYLIAKQPVVADYDTAVAHVDTKLVPYVKGELDTLWAEMKKGAHQINIVAGRRKMHSMHVIEMMMNMPAASATPSDFHHNHESTCAKIGLAARGVPYSQNDLCRHTLENIKSHRTGIETWMFGSDTATDQAAFAWELRTVAPVWNATMPFYNRRWDSDFLSTIIDITRTAPSESGKCIRAEVAVLSTSAVSVLEYAYQLLHLANAWGERHTGQALDGSDVFDSRYNIRDDRMLVDAQKSATMQLHAHVAFIATVYVWMRTMIQTPAGASTRLMCTDFVQNSNFRETLFDKEHVPILNGACDASYYGSPSFVSQRIVGLPWKNAPQVSVPVVESLEHAVSHHRVAHANYTKAMQDQQCEVYGDESVIHTLNHAGPRWLYPIIPETQGYYYEPNYDERADAQHVLYFTRLSL